MGPLAAGIGAVAGGGGIGSVLSAAAGATPLGGALGAFGMPGLAGGASASAAIPTVAAAQATNPLANVMSALSNPPQQFTPDGTNGAAPPVKTGPTVNVTPTQTYPGSVDPSQMWSVLHQQGFNDAQSAALMGNMKQESEFRPGVVNPGEGAQGLIQWRGARLAGLQQFAAQQGMPYTDPSVQAAYIKHEMQTTEAASGQKFLAATDVPSANAALKGYIRYGSPPNQGGINTRLANAQGYMTQFGGQNVLTAGVTPQAASPASPVVASASPATNAAVNPLLAKAQQIAKGIQSIHANSTATPPAQVGQLPQAVDPTAIANRKEALLSPAAQLLAQLRQRAQNNAPPVVGGQGGLTI